MYDDQLNGIGPLLDATPTETIIEHLAGLDIDASSMSEVPRPSPQPRTRREAYERGVERLGLFSHGGWQRDWAGSSGVDAVASLDRDCKVTAIVCANDELAAGAIMGAAAHAWNVPGDVSVTGWDNTPLGEYMPPGLSTVHVDAVMLGKNAIRRLICTIRPDWPAEQDINALNAIIWPGSVAAPARDLPLDD